MEKDVPVDAEATSDEAQAGSSGAIQTDELRSTTDTKTGFRDLPAELRNQIYNLALISEQPIQITTVKARGCDVHTEPGILQTNRQIRNETLKLYFEGNTFDFRCFKRYQPQLSGIRSSVQQMRKIKVTVEDLCGHFGRYFALDMEAGIPQSKLVFFKARGEVWNEDQDGDCSSVSVLGRGQKYLDELVSDDSTFMTLDADMLEHLLMILTKVAME